MLEALAIIISYLLGSFPTAYIAGRIARGVDIRKIGGGNMGALNSARELGRGIGLLVLLADIAKGAAAVLIARALDVTQIWIFLAGFAAVIGHCWTIFLKFRGGKGAATTLGVFLAVAPLASVSALPFLVLTVLFTSNVTLGIAVSVLFYALFVWLFGYGFPVMVDAILMSFFLGIRYAPTAWRGLRKTGNFKDFIIERNYKPWQAPRKNPPHKPR